MGLITQLISSNGYITVNRALARLYGVETALVLGELASEYEYWAAHSKLVDGYFYSTVENIQEATTIPVKRQRAALTKLQDAGIIDVQIKGLPARRYIRINESRLFDVLSECENGETSSCETQEQDQEKRENKLGQNGQTGSAETAKLDCPKRPTNNNNITRTINKEDGCARAGAGEDTETGIETGEIASHSSTTYAVESGSPFSIVSVPPSPSGAAPLPPPNSVPGRDPSYAEVAAEYQRNFGMQPMGVISDTISQGLQELCPEAVIYAIHAAKNAGTLRAPWRYMSRVIESMVASGVKDMAGVEAYKEQVERQNDGRSQPKQKTWEEIAEEAERLAVERQSAGGRIPLSEKWAKVAEEAERLAAERDKNHDS